jgi:hypothetical protein
MTRICLSIEDILCVVNPDKEQLAAGSWQGTGDGIQLAAGSWQMAGNGMEYSWQ